MNLKIDKKADALYFKLNESKVIDSEEVSPGIILDYNDKDEVIGIEILHLSQRTEELNLQSLHYETV